MEEKPLHFLLCTSNFHFFSTLSARAPTSTANSRLIHCTQDKPTHMSSGSAAHTAAHCYCTASTPMNTAETSPDFLLLRHMQSLCRRIHTALIIIFIIRTE